MEHLVIGIDTITLYALLAVVVAAILYLVGKNSEKPGTDHP
jgi:hypothetical protein